MSDALESLPWGTNSSCNCKACRARISAAMESPEMAEVRRLLMVVGEKHGMRIWIKGEVMGDCSEAHGVVS